MYTCSLQCSGSLYFNDAHAAAADLVDVLEEAERRDVDAHFPGSFQYSIVLRHIKVYAVYRYIHFVHCYAASFPLRILEYGFERTFFHANATLDTFVLIDNEWSVLVAGDGADRAVLLTDAAVLACIVGDDELEHGKIEINHC